MEQTQYIGTNTVLCVAILTIGACEIAALMTGHNGDFFNVALGMMVALAGGVPTAQSFMQRRRSGLTAAQSRPPDPVQ